MSKFSLHNNNGSLIISEVIVITKTSFINVKNYMIMSLMALGQQKPSLRPLEKFFFGRTSNRKAPRKKSRSNYLLRFVCQKYYIKRFWVAIITNWRHSDIGKIS